MRIVFLIIGIAAVIGGVFLIFTTMASKTDVVRGFCVGIALNMAAFAHFIAAARNYRGHWSFVIGIALIVLGFLGLGSELDDFLAASSEGLWLGVFLICMFSAFGALSLWSGHKLHRCSLELERTNHDV